MSDLAEFLLARIADDEAAARAATPQEWVDGGGYVHTDGLGPQVTDWGTADVNPADDYRVDENMVQSKRDSAHIVRWRPSRVLAECEAKRRIVTEWRECVRLYERLSDDGDDARWEYLFRTEALEKVARLLALPYADHPDFREEWRA